MARYEIQHGAGPAIELEADDREKAWDQYKQRTGIRRKPHDPDPKIIEIPPIFAQPLEVTDGPIVNGPDQPADGTDKLLGKNRRSKR